jgi:hypothetical protein
MQFESCRKPVFGVVYDHTQKYKLLRKFCELIAIAVTSSCYGTTAIKKKENKYKRKSGSWNKVDLDDSRDAGVFPLSCCVALSGWNYILFSRGYLQRQVSDEGS